MRMRKIERQPKSVKQRVIDMYYDEFKTISEISAALSGVSRDIVIDMLGTSREKARTLEEILNES